MRYISTNGKAGFATFREATLNGQAPDGGLYFPEKIPALSRKFLDSLKNKSKAEIAFEVIRPFVGGTIPEEKLFEICAETVDFDFPLVKITDNIYALELFHGATLAFKDVGAKFMSRCLQYFSVQKGEKTIVIVATSGDTGGAVASGFLGAENVEVVILYPSGKVSKVQELQLTTLGQNITALEVRGTFDDCQTLAKKALADNEIKEKVFLTSANSINIARWLPQQFYYFYALRQWNEKDAPVVSVPSGNFGNICAGLLAQASGLPFKKFIAACNANDIVPRFLQTGEMVSKTSVATISNAMDVGNPSNFVRILKLFNDDADKLRKKLEAISVSDKLTADTMREVYKKYGYILDPHGAVGFYALEKYLEQNPNKKGFFLATAHPVKFDSVKEILGTIGEMPVTVEELLSRPKQSVEMNVDYNDLKDILLGKI
ncbi:MAG: threonine synthase [Acidobacteria bacterium]|nr:threonine synthase [Acidobacteriota bacterium]